MKGACLPLFAAIRRGRLLRPHRASPTGALSCSSRLCRRRRAQRGEGPAQAVVGSGARPAIRGIGVLAAVAPEAASMCVDDMQHTGPLQRHIEDARISPDPHPLHVLSDRMRRPNELVVLCVAGGRPPQMSKDRRIPDTRIRRRKLAQADGDHARAAERRARDALQEVLQPPRGRNRSHLLRGGLRLVAPAALLEGAAAQAGRALGQPAEAADGAEGAVAALEEERRVRRPTTVVLERRRADRKEGIGRPQQHEVHLPAVAPHAMSKRELDNCHGPGTRHAQSLLGVDLPSDTLGDQSRPPRIVLHGTTLHQPLHCGVLAEGAVVVIETKGHEALQLVVSQVLLDQLRRRPFHAPEVVCWLKADRGFEGLLLLPLGRHGLLTHLDARLPIAVALQGPEAAEPHLEAGGGAVRAKKARQRASEKRRLPVVADHGRVDAGGPRPGDAGVEAAPAPQRGLGDVRGVGAAEERGPDAVLPARQLAEEHELEHLRPTLPVKARRRRDDMQGASVLLRRGGHRRGRPGRPPVGQGAELQLGPAHGPLGVGLGGCARRPQQLRGPAPPSGAPRGMAMPGGVAVAAQELAEGRQARPPSAVAVARPQHRLVVHLQPLHRCRRLAAREDQLVQQGHAPSDFRLQDGEPLDHSEDSGGKREVPRQIQRSDLPGRQRELPSVAVDKELGQGLAVARGRQEVQQLRRTHSSEIRVQTHGVHKSRDHKRHELAQHDVHNAPGVQVGIDNGGARREPPGERRRELRAEGRVRPRRVGGALPSGGDRRGRRRPGASAGRRLQEHLRTQVPGHGWPLLADQRASPSLGGLRRVAGLRDARLGLATDTNGLHL
mmetsp:Transcript_67687/g.218911  ORF Transcript_67687/g.218911 Transcript_67687/m.218911 type:complete len:836 (+) Transcript_67687:35-2542(+)